MSLDTVCLEPLILAEQPAPGVALLRLNRPKARNVKPASPSSHARLSSVSARETPLHGVSKKQAMAPNSEPHAPSLFGA